MNECEIPIKWDDYNLKGKGNWFRSSAIMGVLLCIEDKFSVVPSKRQNPHLLRLQVQCSREGSVGRSSET